MDRETAERLLSGAEPTPRTVAVANLLASAAAPATASELAGEYAALAAFRAVKRSPKTLRVPVRRLLVLKVSAIAALVTAGGLAFASGTGILPTPFRPAPAVSMSSATSPGKTPSANRLGSSPGALSTTVGTTATPSSQPPAAITALCHSYLGQNTEDRRKSLKKKEFEQLVIAAGAAEEVDAYCHAIESSGANQGSSGGNEDTQQPTPSRSPSSTPTRTKR
jgi:hypothetical protein